MKKNQLKFAVPQCLCFLRYYLLLYMGISLLPQGAKAYDSLGHYTVSSIADTYLTPTAHAEVKTLLKGATMAEVSEWADDFLIDDLPQMPNKAALRNLFSDPKIQTFINSQFSENAVAWDEALMPLYQTKYSVWKNDRVKTSNANLDLIEVTDLCVRSLRGEQNAGRIVSKNVALVLLIHFVADIHQPLHTAQAYLDVKQPSNIKLNDGKKPENLLPDRGGQFIRVAGSKSLRNYWGNTLVKNACASHRIAAVPTLPASKKYAQWLLRNLANNVVDQANQFTAGSVQNWFDQSHKVAVESAYKDVNISRRARPNGPLYHSKYYAQLPANYQQKNMAVVDKQILLAGFHLAQLLNSVLGERGVSAMNFRSSQNPMREYISFSRNSVPSEDITIHNLLYEESNSSSFSLMQVQNSQSRLRRDDYTLAPDRRLFNRRRSGYWSPINRFPDVAGRALSTCGWELDGRSDDVSGLPLVTVWKTLSSSARMINGRFPLDYRLAIEISVRAPDRWTLRYVAIQSRRGQSWWQFEIDSTFETLVKSEIERVIAYIDSHQPRNSRRSAP